MAAGGLISVAYNDWFPIPGVTLSGLDMPTGSRGLHDSAVAYSGSFEVNLPTSPVPYPAAPGGMVTSYFQDYYNRIHFTPNRFDFGSITNVTSTPVIVWNAYIDLQVTLEQVAFDSSSGLSIGGAIPRQFLPLQSHIFDLEAGVNGAAIIDSPAVWQFDIPFTYDFPVTGVRAKEWPLNPNWDSSYKVTYSFSTEILTSRSGKEQRIALRDTPRKSVSFQSVASHESFQEVKDLLWSWQDKSFVVPEVPRFVTTLDEMGSDLYSVSVDTTPNWLMPGVAVVLRHGERSELRVVQSAAAGGLNFKSSSRLTWPQGTRVHPALCGNVDPSMQVNRATNAVARVGFQLSVLPLSEKWPTTPAAGQLINGRELWLKRPNWVSGLSVNAQHEVDEIDYGRGATYRYSPVAFGTESRRALYLNRNVEEADELLNLFLRMRGRQGEFYMPTWEYDFRPLDTVSSGSTAMLVSGPRLADCYADSTVHKLMFVLKVDGTLVLRNVFSVSRVNSGDRTDSQITVSAAWGFTFDADSVVMCGWVPAWRLSSDDLVAEWLTNSVAQVQLTMQTLEDIEVSP